MNLENVVNAVRGLVRPVALFTIMWAIVGFLAVGKVEEAKVLGLLGGPILGWWFAERKRG